MAHSGHVSNKPYCLSVRVQQVCGNFIMSTMFKCFITEFNQREIHQKMSETENDQFEPEVCMKHIKLGMIK